MPGAGHEEPRRQRGRRGRTTPVSGLSARQRGGHGSRSRRAYGKQRREPRRSFARLAEPVCFTTAIEPQATTSRQTSRRTTAMNLLRCHFVALALVLPGAGAWAKDYGVVTRPNLEFVQHDGANLAGDLYLPKGLDKAPVIIAAHGGGRQPGSRARYKYWGPFLARNGYAVVSIDYRLSQARN